ncbi:MAG: TIGR04282 family arsenosugar biosynthesis glycosyltransferase [Verrucomicrobiota bacterium]|nr:TIGR04282 family arsenosugar biosynthesis glycosyltransferase [Verrucomicrobiota bacterium]
MAAEIEVRPVVMAFLKAPRPGIVKTRLGRQIGHEQATKIYRAMAERQIKSVPSAFRVEVHYAPRGAAAEMREWLGPSYHYRVQSGGDLGQRLASAFAHGFKFGATAIIAIGADCPALDGACLAEAAHHLGRTDVVLGPATDGGYYLIGLRRPSPQIFSGIAWSSEKVLPQTLARIEASGLSVHLLPVREDIDDWESLRRYAQSDFPFAFSRPEFSAMKKAGT